MVFSMIHAAAAMTPTSGNQRSRLLSGGLLATKSLNAGHWIAKMMIYQPELNDKGKRVYDGKLTKMEWVLESQDVYIFDRRDAAGELHGVCMLKGGCGDQQMANMLPAWEAGR